MEDTKIELAQKLKQARLDVSMTQAEVAQGAGISKSILSKIETGSYNPSVEFLHKVADGLGKQLLIDFV